MPYAIHTDIKYKPLELIDVGRIADECIEKWWNQTLCRVNDSVVRVGVFLGEFHWHKHDREDEVFYCLEGRLLIDLEAPIARHWNGGDAFRTAYFNALSMSFPVGEQFFIDSVRDGGKYDGTGFRSSSVSDESFPPNLVGFSLTFTKPGSYSYTCVIHPGMDGVVQVT